MTNGYINQLKSDFAFLDISDEVFEQILNKCIDKKRSEEELAARMAEQKRIEAEKQAQKETRLAEKSAKK
mgnify:CR=1 FL=1